MSDIEETIDHAVRAEVQKRINNVIEEESIRAIKEVRRRILAETTDIMATVVERLDFTSQEGELMVQIKFRK